MSQDIRNTTGMNPNYMDINREERNYAAILFAALCQQGNTERFLKAIGVNEKPGDDFGIYFEYAYLRDLWNNIPTNDIKKEVIRKHLQIKGIDSILSKSVKEINTLFGAGHGPSVTNIQMPGKWSLEKYSVAFPDNQDFLKICKFKWSFNIKPDMVINMDKDRAICIEAKNESNEGSYPGSSEGKAIFKQRMIPYIRQTELQKYMMEDLLGIKTEFRFLIKKKQSSITHTILSWAEAFDSMDLSTLPVFAQTMAKTISGKLI